MFDTLTPPADNGPVPVDPPHDDNGLTTTLDQPVPADPLPVPADPLHDDNGLTTTLDQPHVPNISQPR